MDKRTKEIRKVLAGFVTTYESDGFFITTANDNYRTYGNDLYSGAGRMYLLGVKKLMKQYIFMDDPELVMNRVATVFGYIGKYVGLYTAPDAIAVLNKPLVGKPVLVTAEFKDKEMLLCLYTAASIISSLRIKRVLKKLLDEIGIELAVTEVTITPQEVEPVREPETNPDDSPEENKSQQS